MDEFYCDNEYEFLVVDQQCPEINPASTFFLLLGMIPISILFAMISISQHMRLSGDLIIDEDEDEEKEKEIPFNEKYPLKENANLNKEPNTDLLSVLENTPNGNVFMKYDLDNESFDYWSDYKEIPFSHLETVARKYVNTFCCTDLYLREESDDETTTSEEETTSGEKTDSEDNEYSSDFDDEDNEEQITEDSEDENIENKNAEDNKEDEDSDDEIFAKLKSAEKIKEVIEEQGTIVNKFRYKGKLMDILEFKQKKSKKNQPKNISFSSWKMF